MPLCLALLAFVGRSTAQQTNPQLKQKSMPMIRCGEGNHGTADIFGTTTPVSPCHDAHRHTREAM
jgi:hypothetical protein